MILPDHAAADEDDAGGLLLVRGAVVGSLGSDGYIMRMALGYARIGDAGEFGACGACRYLPPAISHACAQTAEHLVGDLIERAFERHACRDAFRHKFLRVVSLAWK